MMNSAMARPTVMRRAFFATAPWVLELPSPHSYTNLNAFTKVCGEGRKQSASTNYNCGQLPESF